MDYLKCRRRRPNPKGKANCLSKLFFAYTIPLFRQSFRKELEEKDLYEVLKDYKSAELGDELEQEWEKLAASHRNPSVFRLLWNMFGWRYFLMGVAELVVKIVFILVQPYFLGKFVAYFALNQTSITQKDAHIYAFLVVGVNIFHCVFIHNYFLILTGIGIKARTAFCSFIYRKVLKLSSCHLNKISVGTVVTMMTKDVQTLENFADFANNLWVGVVKGVVATWFLYTRIGWVTLVSVGISLAILPFQAYLGNLASKLRTEMCKKTDERLQVTQEALSAIRVIKMCTWERFFYDKIESARSEEVRMTYKIFLLRFVAMAVGALNGHASFFGLIIGYIFMGYPLKAETFYFTLTCFRFWMYVVKILLPAGLVQIGEFMASVKRIKSFMTMLEMEKLSSALENSGNPRISLENCTVELNNCEILKDISLEIGSGITLITGAVGSGKSTLLKTMMKNYRPTNGKVECQGTVSYAGQDPWVFPSTVKQNILFGAPYDERRYREVVRVCALEYDFQAMPHGDKTIVEDRGINLSKGQQARINLARCVYRKSDIYILDDCLAALDGHISDHVFQKCILEFLQNKMVILVNNNAEKYSEKIDRVIFMNEGSIVSSNENPTKKLADMNFQNLLKNQQTDQDLDDTETAKNFVEFEDSISGKKSKYDSIFECADDFLERKKLIPQNFEDNDNSQKRIYEEVKQSGGVKSSVYRKYIRFGGGFWMLFFVVMSFAVYQAIDSYQDKVISSWTDLEDALENFTSSNTTSGPEYEKMYTQRQKTSYLFVGLSVPIILFILIRSVTLYRFAKKASQNLHRQMARSIIYSGMEFFDRNFIGNVLNRFSKDLAVIDEMLPLTCFYVISVTLCTIGIIILMAMVNLAFLIPAGFLLIMLVLMRTCYLHTGRSLKRLDALTRSPVIGHLNATLDGLTTIRAFENEEILRKEFDRHQDLYTSASYMHQTTIRAFTFYLESICAAFVSVVVYKFLLFEDDSLAGEVGLAISQAFITTEILQWGIRQWAEIENQMTSVERVLEYAAKEPENPQGMKAAPNTWPLFGEIIFSNVSLTYDSLTQHNVIVTNSNEFDSSKMKTVNTNTKNSESLGKTWILRNLTFHVKPREKIAIVGRTGAGKSSIIATLFRLYESEGAISIDDLDIKMLSLPFLRSKISIIPQDPVLFTGSIRENLDPFNQHTDSELWRAIESAQLKPFIQTLDQRCEESGRHFSLGQRQLICIARAIVRKNKIVIMDEATANMDSSTERLIQQSFRKNFEDCTVLIIAHKLESVLNYADKVMVLERGEIVEFGQLQVLLNNPDGRFYGMVENAGLLIK